MDKKQLVIEYWHQVARQDASTLRAYFAPDAIINWHNTNEQFSVDEFLVANCEYPGSWYGRVERIEVVSDDVLVAVAFVWTAEERLSCHAVSFFQFRGDKIVRIDEYWGDNGMPPEWRLNKGIGKAIR